MKRIYGILETDFKFDPFLLFLLLFSLLSISLAFVPLSLLVKLGEFVSPLGTLQNKTILLFEALKIILPIIGFLGLIWLLISSKITNGISRWFQSLVNSLWSLPVIMILGLGLRLFWIFIYPTQLYADSIWYFEKGIEISSGYGYVYDLESMRPTAAWPVGYPAFLAFLFFFTGPSELVAKLANVALSLMTIYLTYIYGKWIFNRTIGIFSAFFISILPGYIIYSNLVSTDILFAFLTTAALILAIKPIAGKSHKRLYPHFFGFMTGLFDGAAALVRSTGLLLFPLWIFIRWLGRREGRSIILRWGVGLLVGTAGIVLPWTLRNYLVFDEFVPISTNGGWNFWMGNNPHAYGGYIATNNPEINPLLPLIGDEFAVDKTGYELGMKFIRENPLQVIKLIPAKIFYMYNSNDHGLVWNSLSAVD
ncbi:MAG: ArnT family glycosyltransferase, partial [Anaerolineales bacterium]